MNEAIVEGYPELSHVFLPRLERFDDLADDVEAFLWVAELDFSADNCFAAYEDSGFGFVEVLYGVVCVHEGYVYWECV